MIRVVGIVCLCITANVAIGAEPYVKLSNRSSGTLITCPDGKVRVLTCAHGLDKAGATISVKFKNASWHEATVARIDFDRDLALIEVEHWPATRTPGIAKTCPESGDAHVIGWGKDILANRPTKILGYVTTTVAYKEKNLDPDKRRRLVRVDSVGRLGDSGGALVVKGQLVGVIISGDDKDAYAVPAEQIQEFLEE